MLIYAWIEDFRNIKGKGILFTPYFDIKVSGNDTVYMGNTNKTMIPMRYYLRHIEIIPKQATIPNENVSMLIGRSATGKSNILDCINLHYREHNTKFCFLVFYNPKNDSFMIQSYGIKITSNISFTEKAEDHNIFNYYTAGQFKIDGVHYTYNKKIGAGLWTSQAMLRLTNISKNELKNYFSMAFNTVLNFKDTISKKFDNNLGKIVVTLPPVDERQKEPFFIYTAPYNKPYPEHNCKEAKACFIYRLFECTRTMFMKFMSSFFQNTLAMISEGHDGWNEWQFKNEKFLDKFFTKEIRMPRDPHSNSSGWQDYDYKHIFNAIDNFFDEYFKRDEEDCPSTRYIQPSQKEFVEVFKNLIQKLVDLDEKYFTAFFKLEMEFDPAFSGLVLLWENFLHKGDIKIQREEMNLVNGITFSVEHWSAGQEQFIRFLSLLARDLCYTPMNNNYILLIDEPDIHLDIQAQSQFLDNIRYILDIVFNSRNYLSLQIIVATHSQFVIKNAIEKYSDVLSINNCFTRSGEMFIRTINHKCGISNPMSYGQILFEFFDMTSVDFHIELYNRLAYETKDTNRLAASCMTGKSEYERMDILLNDTSKTYYPQLRNGNRGSKQDVSLSTFIRHKIHHGDNPYNANYTEADLLKSINNMKGFF